MTIVVPNVGEEFFLDSILAAGYTLRLYTNDVTAGLDDEQIDALVAGDFTEATFAGYSASAITGGTWTTTQADPTVGTNTQRTFTRSSTGTPQTVYGYYVTRTTGGALAWFEKFPGPITVTNNGDAIAVTPTLTLDDDQEATVSARGIVGTPFTSAASAGPYSADGTTDMVLTNMPVIAGRTYAFHLHTYASLSGAATWHLTLAVNGTHVGRLGTVTSTASLPVDGTVYWTAAATQATDDFAVFVDEVSGTETLSLNGAASVPRTFTMLDVGVAS